MNLQSQDKSACAHSSSSEGDLLGTTLTFANRESTNKDFIVDSSHNSSANNSTNKEEISSIY